ncbi:MAG: TetR family transcriptional regulator [Oxalobacter sp.]|nr:TetR family transcriptional regulator [Oxalobacter sp.]
MQYDTPLPKRRGRPPKQPKPLQTRDLLLRTGLEIVTEKGFSASGLDEILKQAGVPKGSFYYYFKSKEAFGLELIRQYGDFFAHKLEKHFSHTANTPMARLQAFVEDAREGMAKYRFRRGCLVGKLGQEIPVLPDSFREGLTTIFADWKARVAAVLLAAQEAGEISPHVDCVRMAAFFWTGWEGAVLQAGLEQSVAPLDLFTQTFFDGLKKV